MAWTWKLESVDGSPVTLDHDVPEFPSQSDAETWLGEVWRDLADAGAAQASLLDGGHVAYGPMSLQTE